jgi:hypothetical protein
MNLRKGSPPPRTSTIFKPVCDSNNPWNGSEKFSEKSLRKNHFFKRACLNRSISEGENKLDVFLRALHFFVVKMLPAAFGAGIFEFVAQCPCERIMNLKF